MHAERPSESEEQVTGSGLTPPALQFPIERRYTVLIVPERGAETQRLHVTTTHVVALRLLARLDGAGLRKIAVIGSLVAFISMALGVALVWHYAATVGRAVENTRLKEENLQAKADLSRLEGQVAHVRERLSRVKELNATLQNITQVIDPERRSALQEQAGGGDDESEGGRLPGSDPARLSDDLRHLSAEAESQEDLLRALSGYLEDRQALLSSAPSIWPARGWVTSEFGYRIDPYTSERKHHPGLDIANAPGTPVVAPADGFVIYAAVEPSYGNVIVIDHGNDVKTRYAHLSRSDVKTGDRIRRGQRIGAMGNTGRSTGPHLHYEVRVAGITENPRRFILDTPQPSSASWSVGLPLGGD